MFVHDLIVSVAGALFPITPLLPYYHLVSDERLAHVCHLHPCKTERQFIDDLDFLCRHYRPVAVSDLVDHARHGKRISKKSFLLTFDDGYRQIHSVVAPILVRKGVPAIFFLASDFIGNAKLGYRNKASLLVEHLLRHPATRAASEREALKILPAGPGDPLARLLGVRYEDAAVLDGIAALIGIDFEEYLRTERPYLSHDEVRRMIGMGFHVGAHSLDHPHFQDLSPAEQLRQTRESLAAVRREFAPAHALFAFPHSDLNIGRAFFDAIGADVDLTFGTAGLRRDSVATNLQRISFETALRPAQEILARRMIKAIAAGPSARLPIPRGPAGQTPPAEREMSP